MAHEVHHEHHAAEKQLILPASVTGLTDATRLQREADTLDEYMRQAAIRKGGENHAELPKIPVMLDDVATVNHLNLMLATDRKKLADFLKHLQSGVPVVHMSFASEPSPEFMSKIVTWLRLNIHPYILVQVGLQPLLAAGCTLRTTNKVFDFSLRQHFIQNRQLLVNAIAKLQPAPEAQPAAPATPLPTGAEAK